MNSPYYIAFCEGFAVFSILSGEENFYKRIAFSHFTRDIRKATPVWDRNLAFSVAKCLEYGKVSRNNYYCVMEPSISSAITEWC